MPRWSVVVLILLAVAAAAIGAAVIAMPMVDFGPLVAGRLEASLGRRVTVGSVRVSPGRWLHLELRDAAVANIEGGSRPDMATIGRIEAELDPLSLLRGPVLVRRLAVEQLDLLLEKVGPEHLRNWRTGPKGERADDGRTGFPTVLDATLSGTVTVRTTSGTPLVTKLDGIRLIAAGADAPATLSGPGSFRGAPLLLEAKLGAYTALHQANTPLPADIRLASGATTLHFQGTMLRPLDLDDATGRLDLDAPTLDAIAAIGGFEPAPAPPMRLKGELRRDGEMWDLKRVTGTLGVSTVRAGELRLEEGNSDAGAPDRIAVTLDFDTLDFDTLLPQGGAKGAAKDSGADVPLAISLKPDTLMQMKLSAGSMTYRTVRLSEPRLDAANAPGKVTVNELAFGHLGGQLRATGQVESTGQAPELSRVTGEVKAAGLDVQALRRALDAGNLPLGGKVDVVATADATGPTLNAAFRAARLSAVVTMKGGSIGREVVELASTDVLALFRTAKGMVGVSCLLGVVDVRAGVGTLSPLRIRSAAGTISGRGVFDLNRRRLDVTIASESATTGLFALDVPVRIAGSFASPSVRPAKLSGAGRAQLAAGDEVARLPPSLRDDARRSPCLQRGR